MQQGNPKLRGVDLVARLTADQVKMLVFEVRWWLVSISLFLVLRWSTVAALQGCV
jgi:hypothetical protein